MNHSLGNQTVNRDVSNLLKRSVWDDADTLAAFVDLEGTLVELNRPMAASLGGSNAELKGTKVWQYLAAGDLLKCQQALRRVVQRRKAERMQSVWVGRTLEFVLRPCLGEKGEVIGVSLLGWDDTNLPGEFESLSEPALRGVGSPLAGSDSSTSEDRIKESERRFMTLFRSSPIPAAISRLEDGQFWEVNEAALELYGYSRAELQGRTAAELGLWPVPEQRDALLERVKVEGVVRGVEAKFRRKSGDIGSGLASIGIVEIGGERHLLGMVLDHTERKRLEDQLRLQSEILNQMQEGVNLVRISDGVIVYTNPKYDLLLGYDAGELVGRHISVINDPIGGPPQKLAADLIAHLKDRGSWEGEVANRRKDGSTIWNRIIISKFSHSEFGEVWVTVANDVTARRAAEAAVWQAHERYGELVRRIPSGVYQFRSCVNGALCLDYASERAAELVGVSLEVLQADPVAWTRFIHPEERTSIQCAVQRALEAKTDFAWVGRVRVGDQERWLRIHARPVLQPNGDVVWNGVITDLTEHRKAEETQARLAAIVETSEDAIISKDLDGTIRTWNVAAERLLGYRAEEIIGRPVTLLIPASRNFEEARILDRLSKGESISSYETVRLTKRKREVAVSVSVSPLKNAAGKIIGASKILRDITSRKQMEEHLRQSQKMEAIGHLTGGMAHEFNNILASMMINLNLLRGGDKETDRPQLLDDLSESCRRSADLIRQLLAFSRQSVMNPQPLSLSHAVAVQTRMLTPFLGERIQLEFLTPGDLPLVQADKSLIDQVVLNLCLNAQEAMTNGGRLRVELELAQVSEDRPSLYPEARTGRFVRLSVSDTGCGMTESIKQRLFEPFFTTKPVGKAAGLGLATVRGIVQQHRGWLEVESEPGRGSTFRVYLPALEPSPAPVHSLLPLPGKAIPARATTILVAEDDARLRRLSVMLLSRQGYRVLEAGDGEAATTLWGAHRDEIELFFTDMVMPGEWSGLQLAERFRAEKPGLKAIITSGYNTDMPDLEKAIASSIIYLPKPCPPDTLLAVVSRCLRSTAV